MSDSTAPAAPRAIEYLPLTDLRPNPRNPKSHDLETIDDSVGRFGYVEPIIRDDRTGFIVSGHGRTKTLRAMHERGESPPEGILVDEAGHWLVPVTVGWASRTDTEAHAALIALNRTTELGGWVDDALLDMLDDLADIEGGLDGVGFEESEIEALRERLDALGQESGYDGTDGDGLESDEAEHAASTGEMLALADVSWGEPTHKPARHEVWQVGRHRLVLARVQEEHAIWTPLLAQMGPEAVFAPYPEPFLTCGTLAASRPMLLVHPNPFLAGHLLDKHASVFPTEAVERIEQK